MFLVVKTRALLHRHTPLTIMHCAVTTATAVKTSLRTNVISLPYLTSGRARRTTFGVLQSLWARDSCMNKAVFRLIASVLLKISKFLLNSTKLACLAGMNAESRGTYDKYPLFSIELAPCFVRMLVSTG